MPKGVKGSPDQHSFQSQSPEPLFLEEKAAFRSQAPASLMTSLISSHTKCQRGPPSGKQDSAVWPAEPLENGGARDITEARRLLAGNITVQLASDLLKGQATPVIRQLVSILDHTQPFHWER